jgi:hypothetical protein
MFTVTLSLLLKKGLRLEPHEAVAIAQALADGPHGVPAIDNVEVSSDGGVRPIAGAGGRDVRDLAALLHELLPPGPGVPAPLRYAIARGLGDVEAPPFESIEAFSSVLRRFEAGDRRDVVRALLRRAAPSRLRLVAPIAPPPDSPSAADVSSRSPRVEAPTVLAAPEPLPSATVPHAAAGSVIFGPTITVPMRSRRRWAALAVAAALLASAGGGFMLMRATRAFPTPVSVDPTPTVATSGHTSPSSNPAPLTEAQSPAGSAAVPQRAPEPRQTASVPAPPPVDRTSRAVEPVRVLRGEGEAFSPAFSPSGTAIFFQTGDRRDARSAIAMASASNWPDGDLRIMTIVDDGSRNYHAQPSPDGELIAFDSDRDGERGVYLANRDGSHVRRVSGPGYAALPTWSPDGTRLTYIRAEPDRPSVWNLWLQPVDGGAPRRITRYSYGQTWSASWFPDSTRIGYTHEDSLFILDLESGRTSQFASPFKGALVRTAAVSPDGSKVVFQVFRHGAWLLNVADGSMQCVLSDPTAEEFAWAPDGARIAFHSKRDGQWGIYLLSRG